MKSMKSLSYLMLAFVTSTLVHGQIIQDFGIKVGASISNFRITDARPIVIGNQTFYIDYIQDDVVNPSISCFADLLKSDHLNLQAEISYMRKGASKTSELLVTSPENPEGNGEKVSVTNEIGLQYVGLALIAQPRQSLGDAQVYGQVGSTLNYLLSSSQLTIFSDHWNNFQVGYLIGLGVDPSQILHASVFVEVRYNADFGYFYQSSAKFWNRSWMFCVGTRL